MLLACSALVSGCASLIEGTTQQISVSTTPSGAHCLFLRNGNTIATIPSTPRAVTIEKTRDDLVIVCNKRGYASATFVNKSGLAMVAYANILTAGLSWAVDTSRGADNKYQGQVELALAPLPVGSERPAEPRPFVPDQPPSPPPPMPEPVPRARVSAPAPAPAPPAPAPAAPAPAGPQVSCTASDGSVIRVTGNACPAGWTPAR
jgi:hypothetical protein